jgi:glyoxylase-like metal-dependent hydrolase (beta-lactamase superfamily II)
MFIKAVESGPFYTIGYLVGNEKMKQAVIVDAPKDSTSELLAAAKENGFTLIALINTHGHWDHIADNYEIQQAANIPIWVHRNDEHYLKNPTSILFQLPFTIQATQADTYLNDGDEVAIGTLKFNVLLTPGHTEGGICLYEPNEKVVFVGDTLFANSVGRTDLLGGSWETLIASIANKLLTLDDDVVVYAGHGPPTTIGRERKMNSFLQADGRS